MTINSRNSVITIEQLKPADIPVMIDAFQRCHWQKPAAIFDSYLQEQFIGDRVVWVAYVRNQQFAGYLTLKWRSLYPHFRDANIPEVMDLNVLPQFRKMGIGSQLLEIAEDEAISRSKTIGLGVGLYAGEDGGYGAAQSLYVKRGYIPDGKGVTYNYEPTIPGHSYPLDDELILWFTKQSLK